MGEAEVRQRNQSGRCSFATLTELDEFLSSLTTTKNRWFHRGGFSPATLVFGELPRIPGELLSDDHVGLAGIADQFDDPLEADTAAGEFRRRYHIREQAKQLAMEQTSKEAISRAVKAAPHQSRAWVVDNGSMFSEEVDHLRSFTPEIDGADRVSWF